MNYINKRIYLAIFILILITTLLFNVNGLADNRKDEQELLSQIEAGDNLEVITIKNYDITGDRINDKIALIGERSFKESTFTDYLIIAVLDGKTNNILQASYNNFAGYKPELVIRDFNGDKVNDVLISVSSGGSGGFDYHLITTFNNNKVVTLFSDDNNRGVRVKGKYIDSFKAVLDFENLVDDVSIDLSFNRENYIKNEIYTEGGALLKETAPYSYPFSKLEAVDIDNDGTYELKGYQKIIGTDITDTISGLETIWKYKNNKWIIEDYSIQYFYK